MIRWATPDDVPAMIRVMQQAKTGCSWMTYADMDGYALVDDVDGLRGYVRFHFGRPETEIRQLVVHPDHQGNAVTARRLLLRLVDCARQYGSQTVEGFVHHDNPVMRSIWQRVGAQEDAGVRVRMPLKGAERFR